MNDGEGVPLTMLGLLVLGGFAAGTVWGLHRPASAAQGAPASTGHILPLGHILRRLANSCG